MEAYVNQLFNECFNTTNGYFYFVDLLKKEFPYLNINEANLKTLKFTQMTESEFQETMSHGIYFARDNSIKLYTGKFVNPESLIETIIHELVHAITSKIVNDLIIEGYNFRTKNGPSLFVYLNEGITQYIVNKILRNKTDAYPFEVTIVEQLIALGNEKSLLEGYFQMDYKVLLNYLQNLDESLNVAGFVNKTYYGFKFFYSSIFNDFYLANIARKEFYKYSESKDNDIFYVIQEDLLRIYNKSNKKIDNFSELMLDSKLAESNINPPETPPDKILDINICGFSNIDELKASLGRK